MMLTRNQTIGILMALSAVALFFFLFSFFSFHKGLPTGDSQKSIIWAQRLLETGRLPNYQEAIPFLNRDPVDFYTPALHVLTAGLLRVGGLTAIGISAIVFSILAALVAAATAYYVLPEAHKRFGAILSFILLLTQERFLRYVREPGYHFQNIIGEVLLFSLLLFGLTLVDRWRWKTFALAMVVAMLLALSHQFSAFLAPFILLPVVVALTFKHRRLALTIAPVIIIFVIAAALLGLQEKIPHIFTSTPHLLSQTPSPIKVLQLMQPAWTLIGVGGLVLLTKQSRQPLSRAAFITSAAILLLLFQGPHLGIDIPPIRTLLYSAIPLSITGAYFISALWQKTTASLTTPSRIWSQVIVVVFVACVAGSSAARAFTLSHAPRTNSTLTPGQLELVEFLKKQPGTATLVDDYNRRSASWLVLSGHPMYTRIAADLETQMSEARQSQLRYELYLNQLDYEKIFSLGSRQEIVTLMQKHEITWLTGIDGSSVSHFQHNPALEEVKKVDDITLFRLRNTPEVSRSDSSGVAKRGTEPATGESAGRSALTQWLLKPSTLANDIGDLEDTYEHLPASLRATRLSEPQWDGNRTFRTTTTPLIPISFNVGDYVRALWEKEHAGRPDIAVELLVELITPIPDLEISTSTGDRYPWRGSGTLLKIPASAVPFDEQGFITFAIHNPNQQLISFDLIALGLAHTP